MKYKLYLNNNKGSSLIITILILIVMSLTGIAIITVTVSNFEMSVFYGDVNKAYYTAEAGADQVTKMVDEMVAQAQEEARTVASEELKQLMFDKPQDYRSTNDSASPSPSPVVDGSVDYTKFDTEFKNEYDSALESSLTTTFDGIDTDLALQKKILGTDDATIDGVAYKEIEATKGIAYINSAQFDDVNDKLTVVVKGVSNGYPKRISIVYNLRPDPLVSPYALQVKTAVKKPTNYSLFQKALVAQKNIISVNGMVDVGKADVSGDILGDVLAFGTVPGVGDVEDQTADWKKYGGIIAGMTSDYYNDGESLDKRFGFSLANSFESSSGSFNIIGNATTMSYIHSMYGTRTNHSDIKIRKRASDGIGGNTFARGLRCEEMSNFSEIETGDAYVLDNLQIDANIAKANINGSFYGVVDAGYMIDGTNGSTPDADDYTYKKTSSVVVNGDSTINFNGDAVYIGGSTFLSDITKNVGGVEQPYMTGISVLKSGSRTYKAYSEETESGGIYWYGESGSQAGAYSEYNMVGVGVKSMLTGKLEAPDNFPATYRGMHFKSLWDSKWSLDDLFSVFVNTGSITIAPSAFDITSGKVKGYSTGAIVANEHVYGGLTDFTKDSIDFHAVQLSALERYHNAMSDFLDVDFNSANPKLNYIAPPATKFLKETIDTKNFGVDASGSNDQKITSNKIYHTPDKLENGMVYYAESAVADEDIDVNIKIGDISQAWEIGPTGDSNILLRPVDDHKGIIFVKGNIYITGDFVFDGAIIATGNIILIGDGNDTVRATFTNDWSVSTPTVKKLFDEDVTIKGFFKQLTYDINLDPTAPPFERQRMPQTKRIDILEWKQIS